jgi:uncharacterized protein GlcG (DUF336 family)
MSGISLHQAQAVVDDALAKADEVGVAMNVAIVDAGNNLTAFARQDGAWLGSIEIAHNKAYTARAFDMPTQDLYAETQPGGSLYGLAASNDGRVITFAGGIPISDGDTIIGAIGVSGGTPDQDQQVAEAGVSAYRGVDAGG